VRFGWSSVRAAAQTLHILTLLRNLELVRCICRTTERTLFRRNLNFKKISIPDEFNLCLSMTILHYFKSCLFVRNT